MWLIWGNRVRIVASLLALLTASTVFCPQVSHAAESPGRPLRVAYIEGGPYINYQRVLVGVAQGLAELGLVKNGNVLLPEDTESTAGVWQWLCDNAGGDAIEFVPDAYYSADWNNTIFSQKRADLVKRLNAAGDIDLVLAFGTMAGQAMAADDHKTPTVVLSVTDAVTAGIIPSPEDSGRDHVFAMIEPNRYYREVVLFHNIFRFKRLGIAYEDTEQGRASAALSQIRRAAGELGFDLAECTDAFNFVEAPPATKNLIACHERLARDGTDAVYITVNMGMQPKAMPEILRPLLERRLPTFSQHGVDEVKHGVLLSISQVSFSGQGLFAAKVIGNILKGESPRAQKQAYEEPLSLAINLRTAMSIGWNPPLAVLAAVDEIFQRR